MIDCKGLVEPFINACARGDRPAARAIITRAHADAQSPQTIVQTLLWPAYLAIDQQHREDNLSAFEYRVATRLLRAFVHQTAAAYHTHDAIDRSAIVFSGPEESDEIAGQIAADLLEAAGYAVVFAGGAVANDEILERAQTDAPDALVFFASAAPDLPRIRTLVDTINEIGALASTQIVLGAGVFGRAKGLAEEVGADLWADDPFELVESMLDEPDRKMDPSQRTVGAISRAPKGQRKAA